MSLSHSAATVESRELVRLSTEELREFRDRERAVYEAIKSRATPSIWHAASLRPSKSSLPTDC